MIDFEKITSRLYIVKQNGKRVTDVPVTKEELVKVIEGLELTDEDQILIERFYGDAY